MWLKHREPLFHCSGVIYMTIIMPSN